MGLSFIFTIKISDQLQTLDGLNVILSIIMAICHIQITVWLYADFTRCCFITSLRAFFSYFIE